MSTVQPIVSVIIPVYNAKRYLEKTVESVLNQTFAKFELILVDDGSTDGCSEICDRYTKKDPRVVCLHEKNSGICHARNTGLDMARGKYIAFCDDDDIYLPNYLETAISHMIRERADIVKFTYRSEIWKNDTRQRIIEKKLPTITYGINEIVNDYTAFNYTIRGIWNGIYSHDLIIRSSVRFDESVKAGMEDYLFNLSLIKFCDRISLISDLLFVHYARFEQSTSEKYNESRYNDIVKAEQNEILLLNEHNVSQKNIYRHISQYTILYMRTLENPNNPMIKKEKHKKLEGFKRIIAAKYQLNIRIVFQLFKENNKDALVAWLLLTNQFSLLLWIYRQHRKQEG